MTDPSRPPSVAPTVTEATSAKVARLRAEHDAAESAVARAVLLHEIGVLEELSGDTAAAARDQLDAVNAEPEFREPLERLIHIIRQSGSSKNLGKLLERLAHVADGAEERVRALLDHAQHLCDVEANPDAARAVLEEAAQEKPDDAAVFLSLELLAGKLGDQELRSRALAARAEHCQQPTWKALLLLDLAKLELGEGEAERALAHVERALELKSEATYLALCLLETLGEKSERLDLVARALEARAALMIRATTEPATGDGLGVPVYTRNSAHAADAWLRAAEAHRRRGDPAAAATLLDAAIARVPDEPALSHARVAAAEVLGDTDTAARMARLELERGAKGGVAAALWLRVAEAAASQGDAAAAVDAVARALTEDPASIPGRVLELDLAGPGQDPARLATSLEAAAEAIGSEEGKARYYLLAAETWARLARDVGGAKAALSQAGMYGASPVTTSRVARMLASLTEEAAWYEEATRRLVAGGAPEPEQSGCWFELARLRLLRKDADVLKFAIAPLAASESGAWLGNALAAYAAPLAFGAAAPGGDDALAALAKLTPDPAVARAQRIAIALRALNTKQREVAQAALQELSAADPSDVVASTALASLSRTLGNARRAAEVLFACAGAADDAELAAGLELEAGMLFWQSGDRQAAVDAFTRAAGRSPTAGGTVLGWALRAADPDSLDARRRAMDASADGGDESLLALERFGLEVGRGANAALAREALDLLGNASDPELRAAGVLASALWSGGDEGAQSRALDEIVDWGGETETAARAARHVRALAGAAGSGTFDPSRVGTSASAWAEVDPSVAAAAEWLGAAVGAGDRPGEIAARRALGERLEGEPSAAVQASASLLSLLTGNDAEPLIADDAAPARFANLELAAPGCDPRRRSAALAGVERAFGEENAALIRALAGWNELAAGDAGAALESFRAVVEEYPEEIIGWEGVRAAGEAADDRIAVAEACAALGDAVREDARGAELWEHAALILVDELDDAARGEFALSRAVERDIRRPVAFDRLFRMVRGRKDGPRLLELIARRLEVAEDPEEIAKLYWERARVLREAGDRDGALSALENVTLLEPDHVGALALSGEIYLTSGKLPEAAEKLGRLSTLAEAPAQQRLMSGVAAVDIYENKLGQIGKALEILEGLYRGGLSTQPVRERLARAAAKAGAWPKATEVLEQLMLERETAEGRIEAARLAMVIHRDRSGTPEQAMDAVERLLQESPDDGEALDFILTGALDPERSSSLLAQGREALVASLMREPLDAERVDRLARVAARLDNAPLRQAALGALVALGEGSADMDRELAVLDQRVSRVPQIAIDPSALPELCDPEDTGPIPDLMAALASSFAEALGPGLAAFSVGKKERVDPRAGLPVRNEIAAWVGALGVGDFELYVGGPDDHGVYGVASEVPALVLGRAIQAPLGPAARQAVARELFALKRGSTILRHRDPTDIAALIVAACRLGGYELPSPQYAMLGEFQRLLGKEISRKVKKVLPDLAARVASTGQDPLAWVRAATSSLDRLAAIAAGDVSWVLSGGNLVRGQLGASMEAQERASRLLAFVLSPTYLVLRDHLGMGVR